MNQKHLEKYGDLTSMMLEDAVNEGKILMDISAKFSLACPKANSYEQCEPAEKKLSALEKDFKDAF